jgi:hypothetical protein
MPRFIDVTDVPPISARELGLALKMLRVAGGGISRLVSEDSFRQAEAAYWQAVSRDQARKTAVLVRLRALVDVCGSKRVQALLADHGTIGLTLALESAATMRLNAERGFNPLWMTWALARGLDPARFDMARLAA